MFFPAARTFFPAVWDERTGKLLRSWGDDELDTPHELVQGYTGTPPAVHDVVITTDFVTAKDQPVSVCTSNYQTQCRVLSPYAAKRLRASPHA